MTTPASNIDAGESIPGETWRTRFTADGLFIDRFRISASSGWDRYRTYIRPASVRSKIDASGWRMPTAYNLITESSSVHASNVSQTTKFPSSIWWRDDYFDGNAYSTGWRLPRHDVYDLAIANRAVSSALTKLKGKNVDFGVAFGEYKETAELFSSSIERIAKGVRAFRGKYPREWGKVIKNQTADAIRGRKTGERGSGIPNGWLEYQYGWAPTLNDVTASCNELSSKTSSGHPFRCTVKGKAKSPLNSVTIGAVQGNNGLSYQRTQTGENFCYVRLDYELASPLMAVFSSLGLTNPFSIAWELLPYSFLLDYVLPIGAWLNTMDADFGWKFIAGTQTLGYHYDVEVNGIIDLVGNQNYSSTGYLRGQQRVMSFAREVFPSSPRAGFPTFKNPLSVVHVANALSLLLNAFR